ncbi:substrate-binding domain-containing protein [Gloeobacter kilaueensis]|uniref:ABC-type phosphate transport system, periplasmic component n=1 Tax=Gloeobacter kilaueensis (strain ATCC BAA-2537 / CCAP 1431/1 / ULC 316 / JS1) TaxID=1183438 RepID=U5QMP5_GLOK1|nr:substrate-binding domain-containing protein [Gloeobacter kilaueensis]AGY58925.1 ABC-type phosphate transport system, periplasmic component [Gloeobacter kilaueensis JS1]
MQLFETLYKEYRCSRNMPLSCDVLLQTVQQVPGARFCQECGFPTMLLEKSEIRGTRGTYRIESLLGTRGMGRLYQATQAGSNQPCVVKEYLLPGRCFNKEETRQRKDAFMRVAGLTPADGKNQDFRLVSPWEAVADQQGERCYLITRSALEASPTLAGYLSDNGAMSALQVRSVLNQVLQTLQFLHSQKFRFPSGQVQQGMAHGNLSLDSLLIAENAAEQQFFIYVCDLALWERLFDPPSMRSLEDPLPQQDLTALGSVAFYLLAGQTNDPVTGQYLDPRDPSQWPTVEPRLQEYLYRLMGFDMPFDSADSARAALFKLPGEEQAVVTTGLVEQDKKDKANIKLFVLLAVLIVLMLLGFLFIFWPNRDRWFPKPTPVDTRVPGFEDVSGVPEGNFSYVAERNGTWSYLMQGKPTNDQQLADILTQPRTKVQMQYTPVVSANIDEQSQPVRLVQLIKSDFAITSLIDDLSDDLEAKPIAYDGLVIYVAFLKRPGLHIALGGQISMDNLQKIYTGQITNWKDLGGPDLPIKPYAPTEPEAVRMFERLVLANDPQKIATFKSTATVLPTRETQILAKDELERGRSGIISFSTLFKAYKQCSGYPLAIDAGSGAVQPYLQNDPVYRGQPINPGVNLCGDKDYYADADAFTQRRYPLSFPLAVVYPKDNSRPTSGLKFAELLTTRQGQQYLEKLGVVPLPLSNK